MCIISERKFWDSAEAGILGRCVKGAQAGETGRESRRARQIMKGNGCESCAESLLDIVMHLTRLCHDNRRLKTDDRREGGTIRPE